MGADRSERSAAQLSSLTPITVLVPAPPETVCVGLLRYAANSTGASALADSQHRTPVTRWTARLLSTSGGSGVVLTQQEGPLGELILRFSAQPDETGATVLWITGDFAPRSTRRHGMLERWQVQRTATAARDAALAALQALIGDPSGQPPPPVRQAERRQVRAPARLFVAGREWRGEVLDVSEGGLALVIGSSPSRIEEDLALIRAEGEGDLEVLLPSIADHIPVLIRRAQPGRGGVQLGLQVLEPGKILPLLRRALAQAQEGVR